jgi:predicted XRE-type DNA-binding protein
LGGLDITILQILFKPNFTQVTQITCHHFCSWRCFIARTGLSQSDAARLLGVTQPRISDLMRGKIALFGLDTLGNMIGAVGLHVELRISDAA